MSESEEPSNDTPTGKYKLCPVHAVRLGDRGDICRSYSADLIATAGRVRTPFHHKGQIWVCISIAGRVITGTGLCGLGAYRLTPLSLFVGVPTTYHDRRSTADAAEAARRDPLGFYHGMSVKRGSESFVMSGPPVYFVPDGSPSRPENEGPEPLQLTLF